MNIITKSDPVVSSVVLVCLNSLKEPIWTNDNNTGGSRCSAVNVRYVMHLHMSTLVAWNEFHGC